MFGSSYLPPFAGHTGKPQLANQCSAPALVGWHAHTLGLGSNVEPCAHLASALQALPPPQSAPPWFGSQPSFGTSTHVPSPGQVKPAKPPQLGLGAPASAVSSTQV